MILPGHAATHLTYCSNIHPGERWAEVRENLERHTLAVRERVAPGRPFGLGLRLSAAAAEALAAPGELERFGDFLRAHDLYVFTVNGFPYGAFHGTRVKEQVYRPDWLEPERLAYTGRLAELLAALLPAGDEPGSLSTVPGAFRPRVPGPVERERLARNLALQAVALDELRQRTGRTIVLALEPEPACILETVEEAAAFFEQDLLRAPVPGRSRAQGEALLRRHLGVCLDACHMAVNFEDPRRALERLRGAGIRVAKLQVSAGLEVQMPAGGVEGGTPDGTVDEEATAARRRALGAFANDTYLHQVVVEHQAGLARHLDLPELLEATQRPGAHGGAHGNAPERWRIHFHVPLFRERLGPFRSTQPYARELVELCLAARTTSHLEVETYTWDVLPQELRDEPVAQAIARELEAVIRWSTPTAPP